MTAPSEGTAELLDYLETEGVKATFFQCGMNVRRLPHIAGDVAACGHQIGNHTYSHPHLPFKPREFIEREFTDTQQIIQEETGVIPWSCAHHTVTAGLACAKCRNGWFYWT